MLTCACDGDKEASNTRDPDPLFQNKVLLQRQNVIRSLPVCVCARMSVFVILTAFTKASVTKKMLSPHQRGLLCVSVVLITSLDIVVTKLSVTRDR